MVEDESRALFRCPVCRDRAHHVERIGSRGETLQMLRPSPKTKEALKARRAADAQRVGDSRADVAAAVEATAAVAVSAERDALRAVRANVNAAVGSKAAASFWHENWWDTRMHGRCAPRCPCQPRGCRIVS